MEDLTRRAFLRRAGTVALGAGVVAGLGDPLRAFGGPRPAMAAAGQTDDITFTLSSITVTPGVTPFASQHTDQAFALLTDGQTSYGTSLGVQYDFFGTDTTKRYVDVTAKFPAVADVTSVRLNAFNMNGEYGVTAAQVTYGRLDGTVEVVQATVSTDSSGLVTVSATPSGPIEVIKVTVRVTTSYKLNLTELALTGTAHGLINLTVTDRAPYKAHAPGSPFTVDVLPMLVALGDVTHLARTISVTPGTTPFYTENTSNARTMLTDGRMDYVPSNGVLFDFFGKDPAKQYVDVRADYPAPVEVQSIRLTQFNMNGQFNLARATVTLLDAAGDTVFTAPAVINTAGSTITAAVSMSVPVSASAVVVRAFTTYKLNLTELQINGAAGDDQRDIPSPQLTAAWFDHAGNRVTEDVSLTIGQVNQVASPAAPDAGYYGLVFRAADSAVFADHIPGEPREYGFAVMPLRTVADRKLNPDSMFGMVHTSLDDPYMAGWCKTLVWMGGTFNAASWQQSIAAREAKNLVELPLVQNWEWDPVSDDREPQPQSKLDGLRTRLYNHITATPQVTYWELGLEENLQGRYNSAPYFWPNLDAKITVAREAAEAAGVDVKYAYQIAEPNGRRGDITKFLSSAAGRKFDLLSLHPYAWPDFRSPETWMSGLMTFVYGQMNSTGVHLPIWFTEVGAPEAINYPGGWFGYGDRNSPDPNINRRVTGLSRQDHLRYMIKVHALGRQMGVEKVLWYNWIDQGNDRTFPERGFGIVDFWGFPKPAYLGYATITRHLEGRTPAGIVQPANGLHWTVFAGAQDDVYVAWQYPAAEPVRLPWTTLGLTPPQVTSITSAVGRDSPFSASGLQFAGDPVFVTARRGRDLALGATAKDNLGRDAGAVTDGRSDTSWTSAGADSWLQIDLQNTQSLLGSRITWSGDSRAYRYTLATSVDGSRFTVVADHTANSFPQQVSADVFSGQAKHLRLIVTGYDGTTAPAVTSLSLYGE